MVFTTSQKKFLSRQNAQKKITYHLIVDFTTCQKTLFQDANL